VAFAVAAAVLVVLLFALALAVAAAQERTVQVMKEGAPAVKRWGGRILVAVGIWLVALAVFAGFFADLFPV
jgi:cytochrome c biogenesis protein CcdA